jgi:uncharacterized protein (DUF488 family)
VPVWTVGHSNVALAGFLGLLRAHRVAVVADVRAFPVSRRWPHFSRERLEPALREEGIAYAWLGRELGGYRKEERADSPHTALQGMWRAYADHMEGPEFRAGIARLLALARERPAAVLCAEREWERCHRRHIADHLVALAGVETLHITGEGPPAPHRVDPRARVSGDRLLYDLARQRELF